MNNAEIIERMKKVADLKEDQDLAKIFDTAKSTIANWRRGTSISFNNLVMFSSIYKVSLDWLIYGKEQEQKLSDLQRLVLKAFDGLEEGAKLEALAMMGQLGKGTPLTGNISQTAGDSGMNNVAGGDINMNKDTAQSTGDDEVKRKSSWYIEGKKIG